MIAKVEVYYEDEDDFDTLVYSFFVESFENEDELWRKIIDEMTRLGFSFDEIDSFIYVITIYKNKSRMEEIIND